LPVVGQVKTTGIGGRAGIRNPDSDNVLYAFKFQKDSNFICG
jgi:hypothetical protein